MDISITAVTERRLFAKALIRLSSMLEPVRKVAEDISTADELCDVIQLVLTDESDGYFEDIGTKGDRIYQIKVGITEVQSASQDSDEQLFREILVKLTEAIRCVPLGAGRSQVILNRLEEIAGHNT